MGIHFKLTLLALATLLCCGALPATAQDEEPQVDAPAFFAAKAAASGVLSGNMEQQARLLAQELMVAHVQHAIEFWATDHDGEYPQHINQLLLGDAPKAKPGFYANPYTAQTADELNAVEVPYGWSESAPGNFSYVQMYSDTGRVTGYTLILYGPDLESGYDIDNDGQPDGVILSLGSSTTPYAPGLVTYLSGGRSIKIYQGE